MRLVRGVAMRVAGFGVWWASGPTKEWAEAVAREVDAIESDWTALGWALGGLRLVQPRSTAELVDSAQRFSRGTRRRVLSTFVMLYPLLFQVILAVPDILRQHGPAQLVGLGMMVTGGIGFPLIWWVGLRERREAPSGEGDEGWLRYYRSEIERGRRYLVAAGGAGSVAMGLYIFGISLCRYPSVRFSFVSRAVLFAVLWMWVGALLFRWWFGYIVRDLDRALVREGSGR